MSNNKLRPSGSKRWLECPGSIYLGELAPPVEPSVDGLRLAVQGTVCHELLERCIIVDRLTPESMLGQEIYVEAQDDMCFDAMWPVDQDMVDAVNMFLDYISEKRKTDACYAELSMVHSVVTELGGTADCVLVAPINGKGEIVDLKYGTGSVGAEKRDGTKNPQLCCYGSLVFDKFPELEELTLTIVQPRRKTKKKILSTTYTRAESDLFMAKVAEVAKIQERITPENVEDYLQMGDCYYCPARLSCPLKRRVELEKAFGEFINLNEEV